VAQDRDKSRALVITIFAKDCEYLDCLSDYQLLSKGSATLNLLGGGGGGA
jgi:hypothetical protein